MGHGLTQINTDKTMKFTFLKISANLRKSVSEFYSFSAIN